MPLTDFVRYLNAQHPVFYYGNSLEPPFAIENGHVFAQYAGVRLDSSFASIVDLKESREWGHVANLLCSWRETGAALSHDQLFALPESDKEFVYLDRLVRTLHSLNYLTYKSWRSRGALLLGVHPRHVASVPRDHGLAFESVLRSCGLLPTQIALVFDVNNVPDLDHLIQAFKSYRERGYLIAFNHKAGQEIEWNMFKQAGPELVVLDASIDAEAGLVDEMHLLGARVIASGSDDGAAYASMIRAGVDLLQIHRQHQPLLGTGRLSRTEFSSTAIFGKAA